MFRIFLFTFIALSKSFAVLQSEANYNCVYLDQEKAFKACWEYDEITDIITFALDVKTLGWVGFGFAHKIHKMQNYDVIVGKIQNGKESLTDRFTTGYKEPLADLSQDYTLTGFNESNGKTFLEFHRKRDTGDRNDIEIKPGPMLLVYAYHSLDYPSPYKTKHEKQGFKLVTLIPVSTGKPELKPTCEVNKSSTTAHQGSQKLPTAKATSTAVNACSSVNVSGWDPVPREQRPASSNAHASVYFTFVFCLSVCNLILTALTCHFFFV